MTDHTRLLTVVAYSVLVGDVRCDRVEWTPPVNPTDSGLMIRPEGETTPKLEDYRAVCTDCLFDARPELRYPTELAREHGRAVLRGGVWTGQGW